MHIDMNTENARHGSRHTQAAVPPLVLTFSATDPTGGAGMQADLMTLCALGCHPLSVVTAVTVQDSAGVEDMVAMDADLVDDQARTLLSDLPVAAFKIGVLGSVEVIAAVAEILSDYPQLPVVLDPVLASGRGDPLADEDMLDALCELVLPQTTLVTPNSLEARCLTAGDDDDEPSGEAPQSLPDCASTLLDLGAEYVLITGTHESTTRVRNVLYHRDGVLRRDEWERLPGSYHGSGCTLASAIAAGLAQGLDMSAACQRAQQYTWNALAGAFRPGLGQYIPNRFVSLD